MTGHDETPLQPDSNQPAGWWTCPVPDSKETSFPPEFGFEPPAEIDEPMPESSLTQAADMQLIHAMLQHMNDQDADRRERRIDRTMHAIRADSRDDRDISPRRAARNSSWMARPTWRWAIAASLLIAVAGWLYFSAPNSAIAALDLVVQSLDDPVDRTYEISVEPPQSPGVPNSDLASNADDRGKPAPERRRPGLDGAVLYVRRGDEFVLYRSARGGNFLINGSNGRENWMVRPGRPVAVSSDPRDFRMPMPENLAALPFVDIRASLMRLREGYRIEELPAETLDGGATWSRHLRATKRNSSVKGPKVVSIWFHPSTHTIAKIRLDQVHLQGAPDLHVMTFTLVSRKMLPENWFDHEAHHPSDSLIESF